MYVQRPNDDDAEQKTHVKINQTWTYIWKDTYIYKKRNLMMMMMRKGSKSTLSKREYMWGKRTVREMRTHDDDDEKRKYVKIEQTYISIWKETFISEKKKNDDEKREYVTIEQTNFSPI